MNFAFFACLRTFVLTALITCFLLTINAAAQSPASNPKVTSQAVDAAKPAPDDEKVLPEVIITAEPDRYTAPYANKTTRSEIPLRQYPQSAQVITRTLMDHQLVLHPGEVVKNFSGVVGHDWRELNNAQFIIRGFNSAPYQDNFQLYYPGPASETLINTERVDVIKGPTGTVFGGSAGGPLGGLLN
jgi:iron complex outermembrane receptor protein